MRTLRYLLKISDESFRLLLCVWGEAIGIDMSLFVHYFLFGAFYMVVNC